MSQDPAAPDPFLYQQGECNETAGFLFAHRCGNPAMNQCVQCQKPICERHTFVNPSDQAELFCTSCGKKFVQQQTQNAPPGQGNNGTSGPFYDYGYSPYFYTGYYYNDYPYGGYHRTGHSTSPHDFTDADERSLMGNEPTREAAGQFEADMGGS